MGFPGLRFKFKKNDEEWNFAHATMELMLIFILIPHRARDPIGGMEYWEQLHVTELSQSFTDGDVFMTFEQTLMFVSGIDVVSRLLISGDKKIRQKISNNLSELLDNFESLEEFEKYYLPISSALIDHFKTFYEPYPEFKEILDGLFDKGKDNFTYDDWTHSIPVIHKSQVKDLIKMAGKDQKIKFYRKDKRSGQ